jgi:hypothetical protein
MSYTRVREFGFQEELKGVMVIDQHIRRSIAEPNGREILSLLVSSQQRLEWRSISKARASRAD